VLIVVDTLRADHLGLYGYPRNTSPRLDELARSSVVYDHAISQAPWTIPSVGALLTSRFPEQLGLRTARALPGSALTMAEILRDAGYSTGGAVSHLYLSPTYNFHQGFDWFDSSNALGHEHISSPSVTDLSIDFAKDAAGKSNPFFLFAHYFDPHYGYNEHEGFEFRDLSKAYAGWIRPLITFTEISRLMKEQGGIAPEDIERLIETYDSEIAFTDHHIGRLLDALKEVGVYDDSLIIVTADLNASFSAASVPRSSGGARKATSENTGQFSRSVPSVSDESRDWPSHPGSENLCPSHWLRV
jgi:arylsulfatase A-like enzyme